MRAACICRGGAATARPQACSSAVQHKPQFKLSPRHVPSRLRCRGTKPEQETRPQAPSSAPPPGSPESDFEEEFLRRLQAAESEAELPEGKNELPAATAVNSHPLAKLLAGIDWSEPGTFDGVPKTGYDPLRDGPLRYLGYANEVGEAFGAWLFQGGVPLSYAIAISYVLFDTGDKWRSTRSDARVKLSGRPGVAPGSTDRLINLIAAERGVDTLVWQLLASVAIPGFTIHNVVAAATWLLGVLEDTEPARRLIEAAANATAIPTETLLTTINKVLPTAIGLAVIPLIVHPIDHGVHALLNATLRPALRKVICRGGGAAAGLPICRTGDDGHKEDDIKSE